MRVNILSTSRVGILSWDEVLKWLKALHLDVDDIDEGEDDEVSRIPIRAPGL